MQSDIRVKDFHCNNCGAALNIPKNSKGKVVCPSCKTECIIEGLVKNAEIQAKENINSGIPLAADKLLLNQCVVNVFLLVIRLCLRRCSLHVRQILICHTCIHKYQLP